MRSGPTVAGAVPSVAIYARISLDRHDGEGVGRQLADCREVVAARWPDALVVEYVDNDISAFRAKRRPEYERLLADMKAGQIGAVVAYHPDRLYRRPADLERFIDAVQGAGAEVATVRAGSVDLSTASGRMVARILGAVSKQESERIGERVARAKLQRATQGRPSGGGLRPFGLTADRTALVPEEADELRQVAANILAGASWNAEVTRLNDAGVRNTTGQQWTIGNLRRTLTSHHIAGLRTYHGKVVGDAIWPPIIDRGTWEILRADVSGRRRGRPPSDRHLLTGLLACSRCGRTLWANQTRSGRHEYRCSPGATTTGRGCGRIAITAPALETHVVYVVGGWYASPEFVEAFDAYLAYGDAGDRDARAELDAIDRREIGLAQRWASGAMTDEAHDAAQAVLAQRRRELDARISGPAPPRLTGFTAAEIAEAWDDVDMLPVERRDLIRLIAVTPIVVGPGRTATGGRVPVADRVDVRPVFDP